MSDAPGATFSVSDNVVTVDLHNIPIAPRRLTINLISVNDFNGGTADVHVPLNVLLADADSSRRVDGSDVSVIRQQNFQPLTGGPTGNFREDIDVSGRIDGTDVSIARQHNFDVLP
jgi:hypothetical protein